MKMRNVIRPGSIGWLVASTLLGVSSGCSNPSKKDDENHAVAAKSDAAAAKPTQTAKLDKIPAPSAAPAGASASAVPATPPGNATESLLSAASPDCLACARALTPNPGGCDLATLGCEGLLEGKSRTQCLDTLRCVLPAGSRPSCVDKTNSNLTSCYCGGITVEDCLVAGNAKGRCKAEIESGLGRTDPGFIARNTTNVAQPAGRAMKLVKCLAEVGRLLDPNCQKCF